MRAYLASSIGVACAAALVLPLSLPASASTPPTASSPGASTTTPGAYGPSGAVAASSRTSAAPAGDVSVPGSTQSLPLVTLRSERAGGAALKGLARRDVRPFSLVGVVWDDPDAELHGSVQVRTRATGSRTWSGWQSVETHNQAHAADPGTPERDSGTVRGSTAPLWVGASDGVEVRVRAEAPRSGAAPASLPRGMRIELVDPGDEPSTEPASEDTAQGPEVPEGTDTGTTSGQAPAPALTPEESAASAVNAELVPLGATEIPELSKAETEAAFADQFGDEAMASKPYIGPRPRIITRKGWGADEKLRERNFVYTKSVQAAFVHHSATGNNYTCKQAPSVLRSIYRYHVKSSGWRDFGYNFAVDKCGNIYEGRAGGVAKAVLGAHTRGFNTNSMGIAVLGTYSQSTPPSAAVTAVARLTAWKLGLYGKDPRGKATLTSGGGNLYKKGTKVKLNVISGHRDGFLTDCPGTRLYGKLGTARKASAKYQGR
ncbi:N-acetylmuramoyl-L-alanine amidase [Streptomyces sp. CB03238]|uniref:peptidoglycan recognition protein family protein n=1 Tax=Streptomyces sp. CB03238 TaxID=1907777 RepID=UPI000A120DA6|nr:N-acetylmuramoyl-L-alanine amidase [Streptomyces sp. CB03238]ORT53618.1 N-acetylmuramoyl-L-alanine amidase [Streptomyces sp. CB03238]ORT58412.1 N-acetylmuramoyl-L-alanine amidase [Streptomyces sp. CB03238]